VRSGIPTPRRKRLGILGKPYITGYEPMKDGSGNIVGIYYVGYPQ
jgi:hypothetical protein